MDSGKKITDRVGLERSKDIEGNLSLISIATPSRGSSMSSASWNKLMKNKNSIETYIPVDFLQGRQSGVIRQFHIERRQAQCRNDLILEKSRNVYFVPDLAPIVANLWQISRKSDKNKSRAIKLASALL